ncbi:MAG: bifunctional (p)ppGpp synthetase/guanosine-3',5'-bis(diphosphate) 3'-pyrophosphohydrolase [Bacteroidetes bacterium]|nr:bifunctional (p)ppGpp synthetase/guanosine-3',5'-bis(diphosphate) 3'-pyrophosphohydrolase [Bacteroidota bacterium]
MNKPLTGSAMIERALAIALDVHEGQTDRHGSAYILHPLHVGLGAYNDIEIAAGFLHDVIEDSTLTVDDLRNEGFPEEVLTIVDHLSKREGEEWEAYIDRVMEHEPSMRVKLLDLEQNMDTTRISSFNDRDRDRFTRYVWAWHRIREKMGLE